ncbi:class I lanthipeptide [Flavobacterium sp. ov086]|uniref:class I lanthipeptide n=1 Tax=Flavobacterium sp. ov086 TaxID=1761785 RepID=UPI000B6D2638|nr:class I lanthipeptide [Flavobacterium sp. ov086]SNR95317.1 hypothetical protein SAMN04487979_1349 [Flavobacterium sp. ov086]
MKKKNEVKKKLSLEKFKIAELKNRRAIIGGDGGGGGGGTAGTNKIPPTNV